MTDNVTAAIGPAVQANYQAQTPTVREALKKQEPVIRRGVEDVVKRKEAWHSAR